MTNPVLLATPPSVARVGRKIPTPDVVVRLLDAATRSRNPENAIAFRLLAATGARRGEICGLRWDSVDLEPVGLDRSGVWHLDTARHRRGSSAPVRAGAVGTVRPGPGDRGADRWGAPDRCQSDAVWSRAWSQPRPCPPSSLIELLLSPVTRSQLGRSRRKPKRHLREPSSDFRERRPCPTPKLEPPPRDTTGPGAGSRTGQHRRTAPSRPR
jgi:hypothetical protein